MEAKGGDDLVDAIKQDLIALGLSSDISAAPALAAYLELIGRWNTTYNLTGAKYARQLRTHHLADCLAVIPSLRNTFAKSSPIQVLDVGSGAGLPGIVLALLHPSWQVDCVDAVGKKAAFIRQAAGQLSLANLRSIHARVEAMEAAWQLSNGGYDLIISRAFSNLRTFIDCSRPLLKPAGIWFAMKGKVPQDELAALPSDVVVIGIEQVDVPNLKADRCLIKLSCL